MLEDIRSRLNARAGIGIDETPAEHQADLLHGCLDEAGVDVISGWAWQPDHPGHPVQVEILVGDGVIGRVVANESRPDVRAAGYGDGRCGFTLRLVQPLSPFMRHVVRARRVSDQAELRHSGRIIEAAARLDAAALAGLSHALRATIAEAANTGELDALLDFMRKETDYLLTIRARGGKGLAACPLAGFIGEAEPALGHDAGSSGQSDDICSSQKPGFDLAAHAQVGRIDGARAAA